MLFAASIFGIEQSVATYKGIVLLVVASPCAVMASFVPASLAAIAKNAKRGILIKGGYKLEEFGTINAICFDKTGTLTNGKPEIIDFEILDKKNEKEIKDMILSIESQSKHPIAVSISKYLIDQFSRLSSKIYNTKKNNIQ